MSQKIVKVKVRSLPLSFNFLGNCAIHVALSGCLSTYSESGTKFVEHGGFNRWAEANDIVM
jgi:hypothetical protein